MPSSPAHRPAPHGRRLRSAATAAALLGAVLVASPVAAEEPGAAPQVRAHYAFDDAPASGIVSDVSGSGLDAALVNPASASAVDGVEGQALGLPGGSASEGAHVRLPRGVLDDTEDVTISVRARWDGDGSWQRLFDLGSSNTRYLFATPAAGGGQLRVAGSSAGPTRETVVDGSAALPSGRWTTVSVVLDASQDRLTTYLDGAAVGVAPTTLSAADLLTASSEGAGFIGRSFFSDPLFEGAVDDVKIFAAALEADQVASLSHTSPPTVESIAQTAFEVQTVVDAAPRLPMTVPATFSDGYDRQVPAQWDEVDPAEYAEVGSFTVDGIAGGEPLTATVEVLLEGELTVDLGSDTGAFLGGAAGVLYGLYDDGMPSDTLVEGFGLRTIATKGQDGAQHPGSDALEVLEQLARTTDGKVYVRTTDFYRGFPYQWPGATPSERLEGYFDLMKEQLDQIATLLESKPELRDNVVIEPFNEPEGNMFGTGEWSYDRTSWLDDPTDYFAAWDRSHALIQQTLPGVDIAGPGTSILYGQVEGFMSHTLEAGTTPDIITWHELSNPATVRTSVERFRGWEDELYVGTELEGEHLPININEYAFNYHTSVPGQMIQWISAVEDVKVEAMIAFWNINGNLADSAVGPDRGNGQWWLYNAYSSMTGHTVTVDPPEPGQSYTLQGVATLDEDRALSRTIIGGKEGRAYVDVQNVPAATFGEDVRVTVEEIPWTGQLGDSAQPRFVDELVLPVQDGSVGLGFGGADLPELEESSAYEISITPAGTGVTTSERPTSFEASYEAEDATYTGSGYSRNGPEGSPQNQGGYFTSGGFNVGGLRTGSDGRLSFDVDVPEAGRYDLGVFASTLNTFGAVRDQGPTNVFLTVNGEQEQELLLPLTYKWVVWDRAETAVELEEGANTITLAARSLDGSGRTVGDAIIDKIDLSKPTGASDVYEAELADLGGADATFGRGRDLSGAGAALVGRGHELTFWTYADQAGEHTLTVDAANGGTGALSVGGREASTLSGTTSVPVHLSGGVNKVVVTGSDLLVDRLVVEPSDGALHATEHQAEDAVATGDVEVVDLSRAEGGQAVDGIGGEPGNDNTLTFEVPAKEAGPHAMTVRFSNPEQVPATHYNPNPMARYAWLSINGGEEEREIFVPTFHQNQFDDQTFVVDLERGSNTIRWRSEEKPNWDGDSYASDLWPDIGLDLRADSAPILDRITVSRFSAPLAQQPPRIDPTMKVSARALCINGRASVAVHGSNTSSGRIDTVRLSSPHGTTTRAGVEPRAGAYAQFHSGRRTIAAGTATVRTYVWNAGRPASRSFAVDYSRIRCR